MGMNNNNGAARKNSHRWPMIVVGLLAAHVTIMLTAMAITLQHPGESAVVPDYYEKEISYDSFKAQMASSQKLGWKAEVEQTGETDAIGAPKFHINLTDAQGRGIAGADLSIHCFHWSHGDEAKTVSATRTGPGQYLFVLPGTYKGFWQFELTATEHEKTFMQTMTQFVD